jgi:tRNA threonylcarbamoyladenosine biosynthesis protein TsaE
MPPSAPHAARPAAADLHSAHLPTPEATARLGEWLAGRLARGDSLLLQGPIGAGKSHLARALIRSWLDNPVEDVPSPSFTLVQTYDRGDLTLWHADLYRLTGAGEVLELGLDQAFAEAITVIEWPDRLGRFGPADPITLTLSLDGDGRRATLDPGSRSRLAAAFAAQFPDLP